MKKLEHLLYVTGLAHILASTYDTYPLTKEQANKVGRLIAEEFRVEDFDNITKEEADRIKDYLTLELGKFVEEVLSKEENS